MTDEYSYKCVITIEGSTGTGKSQVAQLVAELLDGEVISCDSMQVYRGMDIGTAKLPPEEMRVPHHLIDVCDPDEPFTAQLFQQKCRSAIRAIQDKGKVAVLAGGTGLYLQAALEDMRFPAGGETVSASRQKWQKYADEQGACALHNQLMELDPAAAQAIHPHNVKRVIRALELHEEGTSYADTAGNITHLRLVVPAMRCALDLDRQALYSRLNERVDAMVHAGLLQEVQQLCQNGYRQALKERQTIGYKELLLYLDGACSLDDAIEAIKLGTRRYAKRQMSWLRRIPDLLWFDVGEHSLEEVAHDIALCYRESCISLYKEA